MKQILIYKITTSPELYHFCDSFHIELDEKGPYVTFTRPMGLKLLKHQEHDIEARCLQSITYQKDEKM